MKVSKQKRFCCMSLYLHHLVSMVFFINRCFDYAYLDCSDEPHYVPTSTTRSILHSALSSEARESIVVASKLLKMHLPAARHALPYLAHAQPALSCHCLLSFELPSYTHVPRLHFRVPNLDDKHFHRPSSLFAGPLGFSTSPEALNTQLHGYASSLLLRLLSESKEKQTS